MDNPHLRSIIIIVQARMSSSRLPGKILRTTQGKPLLGYLLERLTHIQTPAPIVVATSREADDDVVASYCRDQGLTCVRGSLDDVAARFLQVLDETGAEAFVRISADSPLLDPLLIDRIVDLFHESGADLATNVMHRTFPKGMSVEAVDADAFRKMMVGAKAPDEREHVTLSFYRDPSVWHIAELTSSKSFGHVNLSVDTEADFAAFETILERMAKPHWRYGLDDILALAGIGESADA